jgi:hypothetical protein
MIRLALAAIALATLAAPGLAQARNDRLQLPLPDALGTVDAKAKMDPAIRLYWGPEKHAKPAQTFGTYTANKKTNFFMKEDKTACEWAFLSAVLQLQKRAQQLGANAVVNVSSLYRGETSSSETEYLCAAGTFMGGVALRGDFVKLP